MEVKPRLFFIDTGRTPRPPRSPLEVGPEPRAARARPERGGAEGRQATGELEGGGRRGREERWKTDELSSVSFWEERGTMIGKRERGNREPLKTSAG